MTSTQQDSSVQKPLRLWPGVLIVCIQWFLRFVLPVIKPDAMFIGVIGGVIGGALVVLWWLFFSRAAWVERIGAIILMFLGIAGALQIVHESIAKGAMGMLFPILSVPTLCLAFVAWAVLTRRWSTTGRRVSMVLTILLACAGWALVRTGGFTGDFHHDFAWRWAPTPEEKLLARQKIVPPPAPAPVVPVPKEEAAVPETEEPVQTAPAANEAANPPQIAPVVAEPSVTEEKQPEWPGFRGPKRDSIVRGVRIKTDWAASPPKELWRRPVGPGWSSFAVQGDRIYTQEQRGEEELVSCYNLKNGEPVWMHTDATRFWESNGGAGPRGTPTLSNGRVYALGATGILNVLNAADGSLIWSRNAATDTATETPGWGFSASPVVLGNLVIVATAGKLAAYDIATGKPRWFGPEGGSDYSSPHEVTLDGVPQILLMNIRGVISLSPENGKLLWEYPLPRATRIVQPAVADGDILLSEGDSRGLRRVAVTHASGAWKTEDRWTSIGLKPYFNDFVAHKEHVYGFDGSYLSCISLQDGQRKWKGGRYGNGQLLMLAAQDLLLIISEKGELALVQATPDQFTEIARFGAIEGKTWNHPVLVGDVLLVRNAQEMAAFRLALESK